MKKRLPQRRVSAPAKWWCVVRLWVLGLGCLCTFHCASPTTPPSTTLRLVLTTFRGQNFGNSLQTPIIVAVEAAGRVRFRMCLLLEVDHTDVGQVQIRERTGTTLSPTSPDLSEASFLKYQECQKKRKPCLIGLMDSKRRELVVQVELLQPSAGGLFVGTLYQGDCSADDTFDSANVLSRESFAMGQTFRNPGEPAPDVPSPVPDASDASDATTPVPEVPDASSADDVQQPVPEQHMSENPTGPDAPGGG